MGIKKTLASLVFAGALAVGGLAEKLKADNWAVIDNPWTSETAAYNISNNEIVGCYGSGFTHSFSYNRLTKTWNVLDHPDTTSYSQVNSIDDGRIGGRYMDGSGTHGFIYENGNWTRLDMPGVSATEVHDMDGINILGAGYQGKWYGFLYDGVNWSPIDKPGANSTQPMGIYGNKIVGVYDSGLSFLYDGTNWTEINMPGAKNTLACAIDGDNIGGFYYDAQNRMHGFLYDGVNWKSIDAPNATTRTTVLGINGDDIVGYYGDASGYHGFVYTIPEPATAGLMGLGLAGLLASRKRKSE